MVRQNAFVGDYSCHRVGGRRLGADLMAVATVGTQASYVNAFDDGGSDSATDGRRAMAID
jgi:hypothetical protein